MKLVTIPDGRANNKPDEAGGIFENAYALPINIKVENFHRNRILRIENVDKTWCKSRASKRMFYINGKKLQIEGLEVYIRPRTRIGSVS